MKWSFIALLVLMPTFVFSIGSRTSFEFRLAVWFFLILSVWHLAFSLMVGLTATGVRMIDYYYLSIAAIGVFVLAGNASQMRSELERESAERGREIYSRSQMALQSKRQDAVTAATNYRNVVCNAQFFTDEEECSFGGSLVEMLQRDNVTASQVETAFGEVQMRNNTSGPLNFHTLSPKQRELLDPPYDDLTERRLPVLAAELKVSEQAKQQSVYNPPEPLSRFVRLYQSFMWPFILAAAFAIRLTKVTIEVGDWTATPSDEAIPPLGG
jgi:hypothetical protein